MGQKRSHKPFVMWPSVNYMLAYRITHFNLLSNSQGVSSTLIMISLNPTTDCVSDLGLLNSLFKAALVWASDARGLLEQYLMYQVSSQSYRVVTTCALFILSSVIYCDVHTAFTTNQKCYVSSLPMRLTIDNFIIFSTVDGGGGGGGVGKGVCGGGGGVGGVHGWCVHGKPCVISWIAFPNRVHSAPSSSLNVFPIKGLYSSLDPSQFWKSLPLRVAPNIKAIA